MLLCFKTVTVAIYGVVFDLSMGVRRSNATMNQGVEAVEFLTWLKTFAATFFG